MYSTDALNEATANELQEMGINNGMGRVGNFFGEYQEGNPLQFFFRPCHHSDFAFSTSNQ